MHNVAVATALATGVLLLGPGPAVAQPAGDDTLTIYVVDVEGGGATLFVTPSGESVLIDTGNTFARAGSRDLDRIMEAVGDAGLERIDHLIVTHWHRDHWGTVAELAERIPIGHYIDHGPNVQPEAEVDAFLAGPYQALYGRARRTVAEPGDRIPVAGLDWRIVSSAGYVLDTPLPGGGIPNPHCAGFTTTAPDTSENAQSIGSVVTFGQFRLAHLGDLTLNKEVLLMCPQNPIGTVDLLVVGHHGQDSSNAPALVHGLAPRVAIMNNGTRKGGQPETMRTLFSSPGLEDLWQLHFSLLSGQEYTVPGLFVANHVDDQPPDVPVEPAGAGEAPVHDGRAYWIKVEARQDGRFTVINARNDFSKTYGAGDVTTGGTR